jgi:tetratricopeptide (TPR) repeat protein
LSLGERLRGQPNLPAGGHAVTGPDPTPPPAATDVGWFAATKPVSPASGPDHLDRAGRAELADDGIHPRPPVSAPPALDLRLDYPSSGTRGQAKPVSSPPAGQPPTRSPAWPVPPADEPSARDAGDATVEIAPEPDEEPAAAAPSTVDGGGGTSVEDASPSPDEPGAPSPVPSDVLDDAEPPAATEPDARPARAAAGSTQPRPATGPDAAAAPEAQARADPPAAPDESVAEAPGLAVEASADTVLPVPVGTASGAATALRAPTALNPIVKPAVEQAADPAEAANDPEQMLASYTWRFHHETLRELVEDPGELRAIRDRLTEKIDAATDNAGRARLLSLRAVVGRILGDLGKALSDGRLALAHAEATGQLRRISIAQARLAHVHQWRGDYAEADRLFAEANSPELPDRLRATMHEHAGRSCYDQDRYMEACNHFEKALDLRKVDDPELIARTELALDAVFAKVAKGGWGPYPRTPEEILQLRRPPVPTFSEKVQRWGYADPDGELAIAPSYADVQPFRDGVAWVRRPETEPWELIDESGELLIGADVGYLGVGSFHDGLAWVSRNGRGTWIAVDRHNNVVIPTGFEDVRPFRRGVAAVRRGAWGAVDRTGRTVVPTQYSGFATALTDGRYVDGFTDEGLAVVDSGGRKGVVDRTGKVIVPPRHATLVIHPVAFLVGTGAGRWGALDRRGQPLIDLEHPSRTDVTDEIDRLLADTKPVL